MLIWNVLIMTIGVLMEAMSFENKDFIALTCGFFGNQLPLATLTLDYISNVLPSGYATSYKSYYYQCHFVSFLLGPIVAGLISFYLCFYFCFFCLYLCSSTLRLFFFVLFFVGLV